MDENSQEMYLQNLAEFVLDEEKIVTYKWLSRTLNIHVNQSKQLLYSFCSSKDGTTSVSATYLLAGRLASTGENCIRVVGQDKYEEAKSLFESLSSEHVYSVQKSKQTPSGGTLFTADSQPVDEKADGTSSLGAIKCKESVRRAAEELAQLRITAPVSAPQPSGSSMTKKPQVQPSSSKESEKESPVKSKIEEKNGKESIAKDGKAKGGLAAMFAAQTSKAPAKAVGAASSKNNAKGNKGGAISNFFSKVSKEELAENEAAKEKKKSSAEKIEQKETINACEESSSPVANNEKEKQTEPNPKKKPTSKVSTKQTQQKRSRTKEKKDDPKKRKRILQPDSESSDDDMFTEENNEENNEASREPSPVPDLQAKALESDDDEDVIPPTPVAEGSSGRIRRRRKVTKDKTSIDGDGYVVTQKVTEYESYSESDTENIEAKKPKEQPKPAALDSSTESASSIKGKNKKTKQPAKKVSPVSSKSPLKNKQQSLRNFFKKKD